MIDEFMVERLKKMEYDFEFDGDIRLLSPSMQRLVKSIVKALERIIDKKHISAEELFQDIYDYQLIKFISRLIVNDGILNCEKVPPKYSTTRQTYYGSIFTKGDIIHLAYIHKCEHKLYDVAYSYWKKKFTNEIKERKREIRSLARCLRKKKIEELHIEHKVGDTVKCMNCLFVFKIAEDRLCCPVCSNKRTLVNKLISPVQWPFIANSNADIAYRHAEGLKGRCEQLILPTNPSYYVQSSIIYFGDKQRVIPLIRSNVQNKIKELIFDMLVDTDELKTAVNAYNLKAEQNKSLSRISYSKMVDCIRLEQAGDKQVIIISSRLKGYYQLLDQNGHMPFGVLDCLISQIDEINSDYESQMRFKEEIDAFVKKHMGLACTI